MKLVRMIDNYVNDKNYSILYKDGKLDIVNYSEIIDFSSSRISIRFKEDIYYVEGNNLVISRMMEDEILITGDIEKLIFAVKKI